MYSVNKKRSAIIILWMRFTHKKVQKNDQDYKYTVRPKGKCHNPSVAAVVFFQVHHKLWFGQHRIVDCFEFIPGVY